MKTWDDVINAAIGRAEPWTPERPYYLPAMGDTVLRWAVMAVERGNATREEALIHAVLELSRIRQEQHARIVSLLDSQIQSYIRVQP